MCDSEEWPTVYPKIFMIECYESYEMQFPPGVLPPRPQSIKFVYDLEGVGIERKNQLKNEVIPTRPDEDRLRVIASPPIPKPCTISVSVTAATGMSEPVHFSLKFCSPMEYLYHKMRHDPYRESPVAIPKPIAKPLFLASVAYACSGGTISDNSGPVMYDLKQHSGVQVTSNSTVSSLVLGDHGEKSLLQLCIENGWNTLKHQLSSQQQQLQNPADRLAKPDRTESILSDFVESLKEQSLFRAIASSEYIRKDQPSWLQLKKGDEVYVVDCTKSDRWYGICANSHGYFLPQYVTREDKHHNSHNKISQASIDDGFHSRTASVNSQANEVYVTMKSVLEALGGKLHSAASPPPLQNPASPASSESAKVSPVYNNLPISETGVYQPVPVFLDTSANGTSSPSELNPRASHYDVPRITTTQHPSTPPQPSINDTASSKLTASSKPTPSPRQSPSQSRSSHYAVPRPISSVTVENVYDVPRASNNQPLSPISNSHYDVPRITSLLPASHSHYDVPRLPAAESMQSPRRLPRTSSDPDLLKDSIQVPPTFHKVCTPPVTPRRFSNNKAKTLDSNASYKNMKQYNSDAKKNDAKKKPLVNKRRQS